MTFVVRRLAFACVTLFAVLTLVFVLVRIVPGDPAQLILGDQASREAIDALRERLGLNLPIWEQDLVFLAGALRGDWGVSLVSGQPVIGEVLKVLPCWRDGSPTCWSSATTARSSAAKSSRWRR